ncbi:rhomboid family intramembrane serine protease [Candidatus Nitronereus thalassa]|uniref:Rhomboid family intramembrane serine protease n=1 Tax=Candidatus Nitronereus thalassa TaxID=3020898 RepID=A0ABU3K9Q7_9BACT|nr:rhomboid family intramembrane serine protease [Candidatus Nitronereus thalassa]MDT7043102.1 rhomboid family intramembrane serine protease [Candidatus Nitronereus thalassa]
MIPLKDDNPAEIKPIVTVGLIVACVLVFLHQVSLPGKLGEIFVYQYGAIPAVVFGYADLPSEIVAVSAYSSLMTSMFLHGGWMHLIGNMMYLWIFGNNIEDVMGHVKFIIFYAACGILAALSHAAIDSESTVPMVGASGAISGVLGAYLLLYPHAKVLVLIPLGFFSQMIYVPAGIVLGLWFLLQLLSGGMNIGHQGGGVAFFAHIGGFLAGMALIPFFKHSHVRFFNPGHSHLRSWR